MKRLITCGKININIIYIIVPIVITILEYFFAINAFTEIYHAHPIIFKICQALAMTFSFIPFIISKRRSRSLDTNNSLSNNLYEKKYLDKYKNIKYKKYGLIILSSFLTFIYKMIHYGLTFDKSKVISFWLFEVIFITIFSYSFLKITIYKHQYLSIIIFIIAGIILNIINYWKNEIKFLKLFGSLIEHIINSLNMVLKKYIVEYTFCYVSELIFYEGIITLILFIITLIFCTNITLGTNIEECDRIKYNDKCYFDNFTVYWNSLDTSQVFIFLFVMLYYIPYFYCFFNTMKSYTTFHLFIIYLFEEDIFYDMFDKEKEIDTWIIVVNIILFIILFFMVFVFTEMVELNFCKLSENIKRNIANRADIKYLENEDEENKDRESLVELEGNYIVNENNINSPFNHSNN